MLKAYLLFFGYISTDCEIKSFGAYYIYASSFHQSTHAVIYSKAYFYSYKKKKRERERENAYTTKE